MWFKKNIPAPNSHPKHNKIHTYSAKNPIADSSLVSSLKNHNKKQQTTPSPKPPSPKKNKPTKPPQTNKQTKNPHQKTTTPTIPKTNRTIATTHTPKTQHKKPTNKQTNRNKQTDVQNKYHCSIDLQ